jgi:hypothetical protein
MPVLAPAGTPALYVAAGDHVAYKGEKDARAKIRADLIADLMRRGSVAAVGAGAADLALVARGSGPAAPLPWLAANVEGAPGAKGHAVVEAGGVKLGFVGLVAPPDAGAALPAPLKMGDAAAAARKEVDAARAEGARLVMALYDGERADAYKLAAAVPGLDFIVVGRSERPAPFADAVEGTAARLLEAGQQGEHLGVLELHLPLPDGGTAGPLADGDDGARAAADLEKVRAQIVEIEARLKAAGSAGPVSGDLGPLLARKHGEEKALAARVAAGATPPAGPYFKLRVERVHDKLVGLPAARARIEEYALALAALDFAEEKPPPAPDPGKASYIGAEKCKSCHEEEYAVWAKTPHHGALDTLVEKKRDKVAECVDCHVAGFRKAGGSSLHDLKGLGGVQCENCHGPGSLHEDSGGYGPGTIKKSTPAAECTSWCHHPPHDTTFDYKKMLKAGVLGPGHGDELLKTLGALDKGDGKGKAKGVGKGVGAGLGVGVGDVLEGTASWYGARFHGKRTAYGETFDMTALTAASVRFPYGARLRVENLDNGRSVELRVNDRGGGRSGRVLDVSRASAESLNMLHRGVARVRVTVLAL